MRPRFEFQKLIAATFGAWPGRRSRLWIVSLLLTVLVFETGAAPIIESVLPALGSPGRQIVISGRNFRDVGQVQFNTTFADFTVLSPEQIIAIVPSDAVSGPVRVVDGSGFSETLFDFLVAPRIFQIQPPRSATNTTVNIFGENFDLGSVTNVSFNGVKAAFVITSSQQVIATVPFGATNGPVRVETLAGAAATADDFIVTGPGPIIDSFSPAVLTPGGFITIQGANFIGVTNVAVSNVTLIFISVTAQTQLRALVPADATNVISGPIRVATNRGTGTSTNTLLITRLPVITGFTPTFGPTGRRVLIDGVNFVNITGVSFNGVTATGISTPAATQTSALVPANATTGPIRVTNIFGVATSALPFVITRAPIVTSFDQEFIRVGQELIVRGENFTGTTLVRFTGRDTLQFNVAAATQLNVIVPPGASNGPITVFNAFGTNSASPVIIITGTAPYVTDVVPSAGPRGEEVVISGANFNGTTAVRFNGVNAAFNVTGESQIHAFVPPGATTGRLTVASPAGTSTNDVTFLIPPRLISFTPTNGVAGTVVTLRGTNFLSADEITIGGVPVPFAINSSNTIMATIAVDTRSGPVAVHTVAGDFIHANSFTVLPQIISVSPVLGPGGTAVTITGTSFFNVQSVTFNNTPATVVQVRSSQEIVATVPTGATTGPIRVTTTDGTAVSTNNFVVTSLSDLAVTKTVSPNLTTPGQTLTYSITVTNLGPSIQTGVTVTDTLPVGAVFIAANSPRGPCTITNGVVTCALGTLTNGTSVGITLQAQFNAEGVFTNRVTVAAIEADSNPSNNSAQAATLIAAEASRQLRIDRVANTNLLVIVWPTSPVNFVLQSAEALGVPILWANVTNAPVIIGGQNRFTNQPAETSRFYRLRREF